MSTDTHEIFLFPLGTVLYPEGVLPLKVFEQRYIEMTKACLRDDLPFGVCLIREGREVGAAALPESVGCLATIAQWDMPQFGLFHLIARGGQRFRVRATRVGANQLISADVDLLPADPASDDVDPVCGEVLKAIIDKVGAGHFPAPLRLDDAAWVSYRLAEVLPLELAEKQELLEIRETAARFQRLRRYLARIGLRPDPREQ
jgi:Lon protease-like protein